MTTNEFQDKIDVAMRAVHAAQLNHQKLTSNMISTGNITLSAPVTGQTYVSSGGDFNIRITECENGYIISATRGPKSTIRVASSEDLQGQIAACMASLKLD